jgi:hypothetical protein
MNISSYITDPQKMIKLVDSFIWKQNNEVTTKLIEMIEQRKIPKMVYQEVSLNHIMIDETKLKEQFGDNYKIIRFKVGYINGKTNPLNHINFYNFKTGKIIPENKSKNFSLLINTKHIEYFLRVYCIEPILLPKMKEYFTNTTDNMTDSAELII